MLHGVRLLSMREVSMSPLWRAVAWGKHPLTVMEGMFKRSMDWVDQVFLPAKS